MCNLGVGQLVEVAGLEEEGFPDSFSSGVILDVTSKGYNIGYDEFVDDKGKRLVEAVERKRVRPAPGSAAQFKSFDLIQVGLAVEIKHDGVWWKGLVAEVMPAGVNVWMPDVDDSCTFIRALRLIRPGYDFDFEAQQWVLRDVPMEHLKEADLKAADAEKAIQNLPESLPYKPEFVAASPLTGSKRAGSSIAECGSSSPQAHAAGPAADVGRCSTATAVATTPGGTVASAQKRRRINLAGTAAEDVVPMAPLVEHGDDAGMVPGADDEGSDEEMDAAAGSMDEEEEDQDSDGDEEEEDEDQDEEEEEEADKRMVAGPLRRSSRKGAAKAVKAATASLRRSSREAKPRIVYVGDVPVLKSNMYDLETGEPSVFDKELASGVPQSHVEYTTTLPKEAPAKKPKRQPVQTAAQREAAVARQKVKAQRLKRNVLVRANNQVYAGRRAQFLLSHLEQLSPFITPAVAAQLKACAAKARQQWRCPDPPTEQPEQIKAVLRDYQMEGVAWLVKQHERGVNSILADEMGLGKTLQTITFLATLKWQLQVPGPHLVVCPLSVLSSWMLEFQTWCPDMRVVRLHTSEPAERARLRKDVLANPNSFDVAVTTYEMAHSKEFGHALQHTITWRYLVLDEGHKIKCEETRVYGALRSVSRGGVVLLTGTPLQNNLHELYVLLAFMYPDVFTTAQPFDSAFNLTKNMVDQEALTAAHYLLRPFCLRRLKEEVELNLPTRVETRIACPLSDMQTFWYRRLLLKNVDNITSLEYEVEGMRAGYCDQGNSWKRLMSLLMQLRKVVNHPFLMPNSEAGGDGTSSLEEFVEASGKLEVLDRLLGKLFARGHRVVLFSQFTGMMDALEDYLSEMGYKYCRLDGSVNRVQRTINIQQFNRPNSDVLLFLASTRAGALGLNLQTADTVILYDSDWNPQWDMQAMARVHRIGQTKPVHVYRLITTGTVEERMLQRADNKLYLDKMVNRGSTAQAEQLDNMSSKELLSTLSFGADRIFAKEAGDKPTDEEIDAIIDRSNKKAAAALAGPVEGAAGAQGAAGTIKEEATVAVKQEDTVVVKLEGGVAIKQEVAAGFAGGSTGAGPSAPVVPALREEKHSAADFKAAQPALSTFLLNGTDYSKLPQQGPKLNAAQLNKLLSGDGDSVKGIGAEYWAEKKKRERSSRLVEVDGHQVLRENLYSMEEGGISAWRETRQALGGEAPPSPRPERKKAQRAGVDYAHMDTCQICWDGGELLCCDRCPCAYHSECLGLTEEPPSNRLWSCPRHKCMECGRGPAAAGGLLFQCIVCEHGYCEDHLSTDYDMLGTCEHYQVLGHEHPNNACYVLCGADCVALKQRLDPIIQATIKEYTDHPERLPNREEQLAMQAEARAQAKEAAKALSKTERARLQRQRELEHQKAIAQVQLVRKAGAAAPVGAGGAATGSSRGGGGGGGQVLPGVHVLHGASHALMAPPAAFAAGGGGAGKAQEPQRHELPGKENHVDLC